ncbi:MAG: hypothetical protein KBS81_08635 [Spirochaetales bacterium]|nr:hypothetical protein [Candidatus Physcosoma equi]
MSKKSGAIILTATATVTVFAAAAAIFLGPARGSDSFSAEVLENARKRQNYSVASVPQPLETDLQVLSDEERMAEKVASILKDDAAFLGTVGDKSAEYVGEKISDLEEIYSSDMIKRMDEKSEAALQEAKTYASDVSSAVEFSSKSYADEAAQNAENKAKSFASGAALAAETKAKSYADTAVTSNEDLVKYLLSNEDFLDALAASIVLRTGKTVEMEEIIQAIVDSTKVQTVIEDAIVAYHNEHPTADGRPTTTSAIPLPSFNVQSSESYTEEEYKAERSSARYSEIDKILDFLGY